MLYILYIAMKNKTIYIM